MLVPKKYRYFLIIEMSSTLHIDEKGKNIHDLAGQINKIF